jgi:hypothetical protein
MWRLHEGADVEYGPAMQCALCELSEVEFGDGHFCVADRRQVVEAAPTPTSTWRITGLVVLGVAVIYLLVCAAKIALLVQDYQLVDRITIEPSSVDLAELDRLAEQERTIGGLLQFCVLAFLIGFAVWFALIWRVVVRNGLDPGRVFGRWMVGLLAASIVLSVVLAAITGAPTVNGDDLQAVRAELLAFDRNQIILTAARMVVGVVLIALIWRLQQRVRSAIFGPLLSLSA